MKTQLPEVTAACKKYHGCGNLMQAKKASSAMNKRPCALHKCSADLCTPGPYC